VRSEIRFALTKGVYTGLNPFKQSHTLPVSHCNRCLTTEYSETAAHCNGNFGTDSQMYGPQSKCTATFRTHSISYRDNSGTFRNCIQTFFSVSNQQSQYSVFHKLMCWYSLTFRLPNVISPLQQISYTVLQEGWGALNINCTDCPDRGGTRWRSG
jgi:hypothetical protein